MTDHWMISFALPYETLMPFLLHMNGQFIFNEKDARKLLKEHRVKYPFLDFHLIKNGGILMDNWRPTNWKNPYRTLDDLSEAELDCLEDILPANAAKMEHDAFEDGANKMLKALTEEIGKVENPYSRPFTLRHDGFEVCRQKILVLFHDVNKLDKEEK